MLKRKFYDRLVEWKREKRQECLFVKGARQVGKTFIIKKFAEDNYKRQIYINFFERSEYKAIFDGSLAADDIFRKISLYVAGSGVADRNTLLFLDEIQECPNARTALKFLAIDGRCDVIASGSLLGINYKEIASIPVGYERQMDMYALDFEEFLWGLGVDSEAVAYLRDFFEQRKAVPEEINKRFFEYLYDYMVVGGMPEAVNAFKESRNYGVVQEIQEKILKSNKDDIAKYASVPEKQKIRACYEAIPRQLAKETKKFQYSAVEQGGTAKKYANSIDWLKDAGLVYSCCNVSIPEFPLVAYAKPEQFKLYISDIGLLTGMYGFEMKTAILKGSLKGFAKGGIYENLIADMLVKNGHKIYYYKRENSTQEIEFLISQNAEALPVEVKATNSATKSLNSFIEKYKSSCAYKLIEGNVGVVGQKVTLPHYMAMFL